MSGGTVSELVERYRRGERSFSGLHVGDFDIVDACLAGSDLSGAQFEPMVVLEKVDLSTASLEGANLELATLTKVNLSGANLRKACFKQALLCDLALDATDIRGADFSEATFERCTIGDNALIDGLNLTNAKLLDCIPLSGLLDKVVCAGMTINESTLACLGLRPADERLTPDLNDSGAIVFRISTEEERLRALIRKGESLRLEFKASLRWDLERKQNNREVGIKVVEAICGLLNAEGGTLLLGVRDDGALVGLEHDQFRDSDELLRHFGNLVVEHLGPNVHAGLTCRVVEVVDGGHRRRVLCVDCEKGATETYLRGKNGKDQFHVRLGPRTQLLESRELVDYTRTRFPVSQ